MRVSFWNTNRNININPYVLSLVQEYNVDILVMAEYTADENELFSLLRNAHQDLIICNTKGCDRIRVWSNYVSVKPGIQNKYYSMQIIQDEYILCCVHLITDMHGNRSDERLAIIQEIMYDIEKIETAIKSQKTIIIGDFNEMPYDRGCLNANGFHGLPAMNILDKPTRVVNGREYRKFYNPMWNLMGDFSYPPGTYYFNNSVLCSPMWYMLDQVIVSKDILPLFNRDELKIITSCGCVDLRDENQHPNKKISDHFPIVCEIKEN